MPRVRAVDFDNVVPFSTRGSPSREYNGPTMPPELQPARRSLERFLLGEWTVVPSENRLVAGDENRRIEPRTMDVLVCLAESAGEVVSKNALIDHVWEGSFISEGTLTNSVAELRGALGDNARNPRYIETIPKRGYRLVMPVLTEDPDGHNGSASGARLRKLWWVPLIAIGLAAVAGYLLLRPSAEPLDPRRVLIVPLVNRTGDPSLDALGSLAADRLTGELSASGLAEPLPLAATDPVIDLDAVCALARSRGSGLALTGAYYLHEGNLELQIHLIDATQGALLYAVPPEIAPRNGEQHALDRVVQRTLGAVATHLRGHAHNQLLSRPPLFEAYREFIVGSELWGVDQPEAVRHLERAVEIDSDFMSAQLRLAMGYWTLGRRNEAVFIVQQLKKSSQDLTGFERLWVDVFDTWFQGRTEERLRLLREIESMVPDDITVKFLIADAALRLNQPREALEVMREVVPEDAPEWMLRIPMAANIFVVTADAHHRIGEFEEEFKDACEGLQRFPSNVRLREAEVRALASLGDVQGLEAVLSTVESAAVEGAVPFQIMVEGAAAARAHDHATLATNLAERATKDLGPEPTGGEDPEILWTSARALVYAGDLESAQRVLATIRTHHPNFRALEVMRWLGMVASRQSDTETAMAIDTEFATMDGADLDGMHTYSRAAIAAWLGHRDQALAFLRQAQREGWGSFNILHDSERVLFEPLLGMPAFDEIIHPPG